MNADLSYTSGELTIVDFALDSSTVTISENWWQKYGRIVEFQLIFSATGSFASGMRLAGGLPRAVQSGTYTTYGTTGNVVVGNASDNAYLENTVYMTGTVVLHGVYIAES